MAKLSIIGGGPAGLRAAEIASTFPGHEVTLFDAKPSVGRKFLVAGKGGLNLTHGEPLEKFTSRYTNGPEHFWQQLIAEFSPTDLRHWAADLGVETFQATSGRVYPKALKAAPLLRRWIARLKENGVRFEMNHRLRRVDVSSTSSFLLHFENGHTHPTDAAVFALGGASWPKTGSDGHWQKKIFSELGIHQSPLAPANCGWEHEWPAEILYILEGQPLKNLHVSANGHHAIGELLLTKYGIEGGAIYQLGATLRAMETPAITIDFKPTFTHEQLVSKMESVKRDFLTEAKIRWKLSDAAHAILSRKTYPDIATLAHEAKACEIPLTRPRPIDEAISSAGGIHFDELDQNLMLKKFPGLFLAGEMIDWEAPTGGYLMQGCFATATRAATAAVDFLKVSQS
jgi:uncharacterized flavoprotein (TIGR03862 family)